jgi:hypothetical protein
VVAGSGGAGQGTRASELLPLSRQPWAQQQGPHASIITTDDAYEVVCEAWWLEVQQDVQAEGDAGARHIVQYSFLFGDRLAIWVLTGTGELLGA